MHGNDGHVDRETQEVEPMCRKDTKQRTRYGGSPGLVVMGDDSCLRGCGFKSQCCILDGYFHICLL